jgi:hypothetical protein
VTEYQNKLNIKQFYNTDLIFPKIENIPTVANLTSTTGLYLENSTKEFANLMHWFIIASYIYEKSNSIFLVF